MPEPVINNVLIVSGDLADTRVMLEAISRASIRGCAVRDAAEAARRLASQTWQMVLVDADTCDAFALLQAVRSGHPELPVVLLAAQPSAELAVRAIRGGFADLLTRPVRREAFEQLIARLLPSHKVTLAAADEQELRWINRIAGKSSQLMDVLSLARRVAATSAPVLITGESGTGKELIAHFLHRHSRRHGAPYVRINCAAVSESLLESELFGHERGAFTGAINQRKGKFERAHGGTLLLDEISETTPRLQAQLLRVLEQQEFERVGGSDLLQVNVRIISTSNRDLEAEAAKGSFRADLFYRLGTVHLTVPPLRQRKDDILPLVWHFVNEYAAEAGREIRQVEAAMIKLLCNYSWPGNVRQLRNAVRTALILGEGPVLSVEHLPALKAQLSCSRPASSSFSCATPASVQQSLSLQELERRAIFEALRRTQSHQARAAKLLGITDRTLREKLRRYRAAGLEPQRAQEEFASMEA